MLHPNEAAGVHRIEDSYTNWYLVEEGARMTVVDAGVRGSWTSLLDALSTLGRSPEDIDAVVLTHAHFDHVGFAERARRELDVPVYVHTNDVPLARRPWRYGMERSRALYLGTQLRALPIVASLVVNRAFWPTPVTDVVRYENGTLPVPGSPRVVFCPGHTLGHCALHFPDRDTLLTGDAIVTLDPYTARRGPRLVARAATADSERNLSTLAALAETGARMVLTGHGEPWGDGIESAVELARVAGAA